MEVIKGKVVKGRGLGRKMGFPTLNLSYFGEVEGVFVGEVEVAGSLYVAAVHVGSKPTLGDGEKICEAYLLNFSGEVLGEISVELLFKIREVQKFNSLEELVEQIKKDVEFAKTWYTAHR